MRLNVQITGDKAVRAELLRIGSLPHLALARTAEDVEDFAAAEAAKHNKRGDLVASIFKRPIPGGWEIGHDLQRAPHALFVHWGTKPHVIRPKGASLDTQRELFGKDGTQRKLTAAGKLKAMPGGRKLVLRWPGARGFIFAQYVNHPGYKGDAWLVRAAAQAPLLFKQHITAALRGQQKD